MSPRPSVLLFDVMSTLVYDPITREIPEFFDMSLQELYDRKHPDAWQRFECGALPEETFYDIYLPQRDEPIDASAFRRTLYEAYQWIDGMQPLLETLCERDVPMHAFSNYPVWYRIIERKLKLSHVLEWSFVSCNTGLRKPHDQAYQHVVSTLQLPPEECLFVDDRADNCRAARQAGMQAVVFENAHSLCEELQHLGVL